MTTFKKSIIINQPINLVNEALMNADNFPYWQTSLEKFEVIKGKPGEIGSIGHLHYFENGQSYIMEDKLIDCELGKKYVSQVTGDALTARVETTLNALENKTEMTLEWSGKGKILFLKLFLPFFRKKMIKQSQKELETFKELLETKGSDFSSNAVN